MKNKSLLIVSLTCCLTLFSQKIQGQNVAVFCGGDMYEDIEENAEIMKLSGFNTVIFWSVHIGKTGDLILNNSIIISDGEYVGKKNWPEEVRNLREQTTSVNRIEFSVGAWGVPDFENIESLINSQGTGENSILYRNFKKLKEITGADAIDFDDESNYNVSSTVTFSEMLVGLAYKITLCPYTQKTFWQSVYNQVELAHPDAIDRIYLQCYAGGAGNTPAAWNGLFGELKVTPGLWSTNGVACNRGLRASQVEIKLNAWKNDIEGGFMWSFWDILSCSYGGTPRSYAKAIRNVMGMVTEIPGKAQLPIPANYSTEISVDANLIWTPGSWDANSKLYFGKDSVLTESDLKGTIIKLMFDPGTLENNTTYYWRVDQVNEKGTTVGDIWNFTTEVTTDAAGKASLPNPVNNADNVDTRTLLSWKAGEGTISHKVYFGTTNPPAFKKDLNDTVYSPNILLETNTTYYWRVDEVNSSGATESDIWSFTTHGKNIAPEATVNYSTQYNADYGANKAIDGIALIHAQGEWASSGEMTPWIKLSWTEEKSIDKIKLYDRANGVDYIKSGTLTFSDGSSIAVGELPNDGAVYFVEFSPKNVTWVKFAVDNGGGSNVGLSEFEVLENGTSLMGNKTKYSVDSKVYPNPSSLGRFQIDIPSNDFFQLNVYNVNGQLMKTIKNYKTSDVIDIKDFSKGLYLLRISNNKNTYWEEVVYF